MTFNEKYKYETPTMSSFPQILRIFSQTCLINVSCPYKITGKINVSDIFIFEFSDSKQENKIFWNER